MGRVDLGHPLPLGPLAQDRRVKLIKRLRLAEHVDLITSVVKSTREGRRSAPTRRQTAYEYHPAASVCSSSSLN